MIFLTLQLYHRPQYKRNLKTTLRLYEYYMTQTFENYIEFAIAVLLIGIMILVSSSEFTSIIPQVTAQAPSAGNMTTPMLDSARFHLKAADALIMKGDTIGSTSSNKPSRDTVVITKYGLSGDINECKSSNRVCYRRLFIKHDDGANCIIDNQAMARCMR